MQTRLADGALMAPRDLPVGGQAVLEGVMMRGVSHWAVAVRQPTAAQMEKGRLDPGEGAEGEIEVQTFPLVLWTKRHRVLRWPVVRGVVALGQSLKIGFRALNISANAQLGPARTASRRRSAGATWVGTVVLALAFAIGLFFLVPVGLTSLFRTRCPTRWCSWSWRS